MINEKLAVQYATMNNQKTTIINESFRPQGQVTGLVLPFLWNVVSPQVSRGSGSAGCAMVKGYYLGTGRRVKPRRSR